MLYTTFVLKTYMIVLKLPSAFPFLAKLIHLDVSLLRNEIWYVLTQGPTEHLRSLSEATNWGVIR